MKKIILSFTILCAIAFSALALYNLKQQANEEKRYFQTRINGDEIVIALLKYKCDKNGYPDNLEKLVPQYIQNIKPPVWGDLEWSYYSEDNGQEFNLLVRGPGESNQTYSTVLNCWYNSPQPTPIE